MKEIIITFIVTTLLTISSLNIKEETTMPKAEPIKTETIALETPTPITETQTVYIICDVIKCNYNIDDYGNSELYCQLPNGDIEIYTAMDVPEYIELVCLATENLDDHTSYRIVAIR